VASFLLGFRVSTGNTPVIMFSSLSESGFIPTTKRRFVGFRAETGVLISFREWLHSYSKDLLTGLTTELESSHLFQRVASFLLKVLQLPTTLF